MTLETIVYRPDGVAEPDATDESALLDAKRASGTTWFRATDPTDAELAAVTEVCDVHRLSVEDVQNNVRPKLEEFGSHTFLLLKEAELRRGDTTFDEEVAERPVGLFVGDDWLLTLTYDEVRPLDRVWSTVVRGDDRLLQRGPDFAASRVADALVDEYFDLLDGVATRIETAEDEILEAPGRETLATINAVRRDLLSLRKVLWPTREAVGILARGDPPQVQPETEKYFRDVYDHLVQLVDLAETYRDLAASARDIYLNALSVSTNEVMKRLTVVATIVLPLTLVAGIYGMNFAGGPYAMPELGWRYGYPAVLLAMGGMAAVLVWYFRREGWL